MAQQQYPSVEDQFAERINSGVDATAKALADRLGPAPGSARYTQPQLDALWDTRDESVDQQALFAALQQGITEQGQQAVALFRMAPELGTSVLGVPLPPEKAAVIAKLAEHPGRYVLTVGHSSDADQQVKFVADQHRRAAKRQQGMATPQAPETGDQYGY